MSLRTLLVPTRGTATRVTLCAVVGASSLTAAGASASDVGPARAAPAAAVVHRAAVAPTTPVVTAALATTGKAKPKKAKKKRLRFARNADAIVTMRSVRISRFVYRGGQRTIDRDRVAHYTGWRDTFTRAGRPGVYWLAAHNYGTHGPFHRLTKIKKGARIVVTTRSGATYVYRVQRRQVVDSHVRRKVVWGEWGPASGPARAVVQTCVGNKRLLVHATLVSPRAG